MEWTGALPAHWAVHRIRSLVSNVVERQSPPQQGDMHIALEHVESWTGRIKGGSEEAEPDRQWNCFCRGDVLFGKLRPYLAKVTRVVMGGRCVGEFLVLRPKCTDLDSRFLERLLRSKPVIDVVDSSTFGAKMPRAEWAFIGALKIGCPPLAEQSAIVRFLDHADDRIQRYIHAKEKLITLLEEQKQAVIHQAVTGQVDVRTGERYAAYRDSGVEWLGEVPKHWAVGRLKTSVSNVTDRASPSEADPICLGLEQVESWTGRVMGDSLAVTPDSQWKRFQVGDVLFGKLRPYLAKVTRLQRSGHCVGEFLVLRARTERLDPRFLEHLLRSKPFINIVDSSTFGAKMPRAEWPFIGALAIPRPPLREQGAIVHFVDALSRQIDAVVSGAARQIRLAQEFRSSLTADVVTGKLDVRETASTLPGRRLMRDAASVHAAP